MRTRFIGLIHRGAARRLDLEDGIVRQTAPGMPLTLAVNDSQLTLAFSGNAPIAVAADGLIFGSLFRPGTPLALQDLSLPEQREVKLTHGSHLIHVYWGPYITILADPLGSSVYILRAPLGELPCFFVELDGAVAVASDTEMLEEFRCVSPVINWPAVVHDLAARAMKRPETCLQRVRELAGGERVTIGNSALTIHTLWSPWNFARTDRQITDVSEATRRVRGSIVACVAARASAFERIVLALSGGLDSSVVAAVLAMQPRQFTCINLLTPDAGGDERRYARMVAEHLEVPLNEHASDVRLVDITRSSAARLPRPSARLFNQDYDHAAAHAVGCKAGSAIFNGGGGDNIFCSLQSAAPAADRLLTTGLDVHFWRTTRDIGLLAPASAWTVAKAAMRRAWFRGPSFTPPCDTFLMSSNAARDAREAPLHPWLDAPKMALPGKATHVALLAFAQAYVESLDPQARLTHVAPLLSQPVVETCLQTPSWLWFERGQNRVIARRAFASDLPATIIDRRSKGSPDSFSAAIFEANQAALRDFLLNGELVAHDLIDPDAMRAVLDTTGPLRGEEFHRLLHFADVEAWARSWTIKRPKAETVTPATA